MKSLVVGITFLFLSPTLFAKGPIDDIMVECGSFINKLSPVNSASIDDELEIEKVASENGVIRYAIVNRNLADEIDVLQKLCFRKDGSLSMAISEVDSWPHTVARRNLKVQITRFYNPSGEVISESGHQMQALYGYYKEDGSLEEVNGKNGKVEFDKKVTFPTPKDEVLKDLDIQPIMNSKVIKGKLP